MGDKNPNKLKKKKKPIVKVIEQPATIIGNFSAKKPVK
jgi:hypothetical protein